MDDYIDCFSELNGKSYLEQYNILIKAKHEAYVVMKLRREKYIRTFLIFLLFVCVAIIPETVLELNLFFKVTFHMIAIFGAIYFERKNYGEVLHRGLVRVLANDG